METKTAYWDGGAVSAYNTALSFNGAEMHFLQRMAVFELFLKLLTYAFPSFSHCSHFVTHGPTIPMAHAMLPDNTNAHISSKVIEMHARHTL